MNFFSFEFLGCFLIFFLLYWGCQPSAKLQNGLLITASYFFVYSFSPDYAYILFGYTLFIYILTHWLTDRLPTKWIYTLLAIAIIGCFTVFKYYSFFQETLLQTLTKFGLSVELPVIDLLAPLGLSFYAFHSVSYVVSVCRKEMPKADFFDVVLYLSFFPSIVAGPINRAKVFIPQIQVDTRTILTARKAILLITLAITKLFLFSSWLSDNFVTPVFDAPSSFNAGEIIVAVYAYAWHIYFNFSGYTNLVTGIALLLGFKVPINFNAPYMASSLKDFWGRWHISLSTFIRDYIYIPLGGSRKGFSRTNINLLLAMVISGLWHGAAMTFIIWGAIHGLGMVLLNIKHFCLDKLKLTGRFISPSMSVITSRVITFHFVCFAWIFFRSQTSDDALMLLRQIGAPGFLEALSTSIVALSGFWLLFIGYPYCVRGYHFMAKYHQKVAWYFYPVPLALILTIVFMLSPSGMPGFIYANF
ncbi:MBOAT family O-acyltransferase [Moellerella wisconsensis]|uniref:Probable alginate O-acetylase n=1 Tax=Moellerella wisconsensis TaxID=158849 RepID=A0A9Q8Q0Z2_9GAMM|nr:MBOAT family O-acyltransferase [Moellerella wisconsensis]KLN96356.1 alginate O-acetyltransferase [Moellerella wisconsensis]UNH30445.1 MBOAT family protein [Moellerella wisconsensis]